MLNFLKLENNELVEPNANAESLKGSLNLFNMHFKDICSTQSRWLAFDKQLSEKIIMSLQHILLPAYGNFIEKLQDVLGIHASEYIKYGLFDIKDQLNHLFLGSMPMNQYLKDKEKCVCILKGKHRRACSTSHKSYYNNFYDNKKFIYQFMQALTIFPFCVVFVF